MTHDERRADAALATLMDRAGVQEALEAIKYGDPETWAELRATLGSAINASDDAAGFVLVPRDPITKVKAAMDACAGKSAAHPTQLALSMAIADLVEAMLAATGGDDE